jgi:hypothetical protein
MLEWDIIAIFPDPAIFSATSPMALCLTTEIDKILMNLTPTLKYYEKSYWN